jgi:hypothetical protein
VPNPNITIRDFFIAVHRPQLPARRPAFCFSLTVSPSFVSLSLCRSHCVSLTVSLSLCLSHCVSQLCLPHCVSLSLCLPHCVALIVSPSLCLPHCVALIVSLSLCLPHCVSLTVSLSLCLSLCLPHCVSLTVSPSLCRSHCVSLCVSLSLCPTPPTWQAAAARSPACFVFFAVAAARAGCAAGGAGRLRVARAAAVGQPHPQPARLPPPGLALPPPSSGAARSSKYTWPRRVGEATAKCGWGAGIGGHGGGTQNGTRSTGTKFGSCSRPTPSLRPSLARAPPFAIPRFVPVPAFEKRGSSGGRSVLQYQSGRFRGHARGRHWREAPLRTAMEKVANRTVATGLYRIGKWPIKRHLRTIRH